MVTAMKKLLITIFALSATAFCAMVGDFSVDPDNVTFPAEDPPDKESASSTKSEIQDGTPVAIDNSSSSVSPDTEIITERSAIFGLVRNFFSQARKNFLETLDVTEGPTDEKTERIMRMLEEKWIEVTTSVLNQVDNAAITTVPPNPVEQELPKMIQREGALETSRKEENSNQSKEVSDERESNFNLAAVASSSCSNCFDKLQSCVQLCFAEHSCKDVLRSARTCPPSPSRLCNPFAPWNSVNECNSDQECSSPLICCNDGCSNKCVSGVWRS